MWPDGRDRVFTGEVITVIGVKAVLLFVLWLVFLHLRQPPPRWTWEPPSSVPSAAPRQMTESTHER